MGRDETKRLVSCARCRVGRACQSGSFACAFVPRRHRRELILCVEGEPLDTVWFVKSGAVAVRRAAPGGQGAGAVRAVRYAGTLIGFEALVTGCSSDTCETALDSVLCAAPIAELDSMLASAPMLTRTFLDAVILSAMAEERAPSSHGTALGRSAAWLYEHREVPEALALPRRIIAELVAMCPETLARSLAELDRREVIERTRTSLAIVAPDALAAIATHAD